MLSVWRAQTLLCDGEDRKSGRRECIWPAGKYIEVVAQEGRIQHPFARHVPDDGFVEHSVVCTHNRHSVTAHVPGEANAWGEVVVVAVVDSSHVILGNDPRGAQRGQVSLNGRVRGIQKGCVVLRPPRTQPPMSFMKNRVQLES